MEELEDKAIKVYEAMFKEEETVNIEGETYYVDRTPQLGLKLLTIGEHKFLEQNPETIPHGERKPVKVTRYCGS